MILTCSHGPGKFDKKVNHVSGPIVNPVSGPIANPFSGPVANPVSGLIANPVSGLIVNPVSGLITNSVTIRTQSNTSFLTFEPKVVFSMLQLKQI